MMKHLSSLEPITFTNTDST